MPIFFYITFAMNDPVLAHAIARIEASGYNEAKREVEKRRGRDYGFILTQEEYDSLPSKPWYDRATRTIEFGDVPVSDAVPGIPE